MNNRLTGLKIVLTVFILAAVAGAASGACNADKPNMLNSAIEKQATGSSSEKDVGNSCSPEDIISCKYYNENEFRASVEKADAPDSVTMDDTSGASKGNITAGIVPHHLLACDMIAKFFKTVSASAPETVVILAPNHQRTGRTAVSTGFWNWQTAFGEVSADSTLVRYLIDNANAGTNINLLEEDHSVSALIPYIRYYMPKAKVVPVLLYGNYGQNNSTELGKGLAARLEGKKSLVLASVDFSHYLTPEKAAAMDKITLEAIKAMDFNALSVMGNDNLDSPAAIMTFLSYIKNSGAQAPELLGHDNSSTIAGKWSSSTTSYFTMVYRNKN